MNPKERQPNQLDQFKEGTVKYFEEPKQEVKREEKSSTFTSPLKNDGIREKEDRPIDRPMTIMTENDAYIAERMKSQPKALSEIEVVTSEERSGIHRLSLPEYLEPFSYDCTMGISCEHHGWVKEKVMYGLDMEMDRWNQSRHGKYIFRWLNKNKRALDQSINIRGWYLVNRSYFSDAPKILFSVNGGIENGDSILGFMSVTKAIKIREKPSQDSLDRVHSEGSKHEGHPNFYKAKLDPETIDGDDFAPPDARQEGRDF